MLMWYYWGLADDSTPHKSKSQFTNNDAPDHWISLEHHSSMAVDIDLLNNCDGRKGIMESSDDEEFCRHWDELASNEDESLDLDSIIYTTYESDGNQNKGSDFDFYEFY